MSWDKLKDHNYMIYYIYMFYVKFDMMLHLEDTTFWRPGDLDLTLKSYPRSNVSR